MKHIITFFTLLLAISLNAQWEYNALGTPPGQIPGIQTIGTVSNNAPGYNSIAMGNNTLAQGNSSIAMGINTEALGFASTAIGQGTTALAGGSIAMGYNTLASGLTSTALGSVTTASGQISLSMGSVTTASGYCSTAMGNNTTASDWGTLAIGRYNTDDATPNPTTPLSTNRAFIIGNGSSSSNKSDAMTVLFDGTTTISGPITATSFIGDGSGLTNLPDGVLSYNTTSTTGIEAPTNIASGTYSTSLGGYNDASGYFSTAMGSVTTASGAYSTAMGASTTAEDHGTFAIGQFNTADATPNPDTFNGANRAFVIGNGVAASNKSDALTVLFDGTTNIAGPVTATSFIGDGSGLTNLPDGVLTFNSTSSTGIESPTNIASRPYSIALGQSTTASNDNSMSMGFLTNASGVYSIAMGNSSTASGTGSTAMGDGTIASGNYSTAMGSSSIASDIASTAMGSSSIASGTNSTAMGAGTEASGYGSTSMGAGTEASGGNSIAMGSWTEASGSNSTAMGGVTIASGDYSTAMGVGTTASGGNSTAMGSGTEAIGTNSTAIGEGTTASGYVSTAMGIWTTAEDRGTFSIGQFNTADATPNPTFFSLANRAFVIGNGTHTDNKSDAMTVLFDGTTTIVGPVTATAFIGDGSGLTNLPDDVLTYNTTSPTGIESSTNTASGDYATAMGNNTTASGNYATTIGRYNTASGNESTAMGIGNSASGDASTAMGQGTTAADLGTFAIGHFNTIDSTPDPNDFNLANRAFVIGNGEDESILSDAMIVLFDGTTTIAGDLTVNSDARLKSNILSLGSTLAKLLALDGKSYTFKNNESKQKIGLLAQDVQEVFPELVKEASDENGTLSVNYQGLIPVLINAIKEQDQKIKEQDERINRLEVLVEKLIKK